MDKRSILNFFVFALSIADYDDTAIGAGTLTCIFLESSSMTEEIFFLPFGEPLTNPSMSLIYSLVPSGS